MNRKSIVLLAILFFMAFSGLILIQVYWIRNAISIADQQFRYQANKALEAVVLNLEEKELISRIVQEFDSTYADSVTAIFPANSALSKNLQGYKANSKLLEIYDRRSPDKPIVVDKSGQKIIISEDSSPFPSEDIPDSLRITSVQG